jgi:hypothetical protein
MSPRAGLNPEKRNRTLDSPIVLHQDCIVIIEIRLYNFLLWDKKVHGVNTQKTVIAFHFTLF